MTTNDDHVDHHRVACPRACAHPGDVGNRDVMVATVFIDRVVASTAPFIEAAHVILARLNDAVLTLERLGGSLQIVEPMQVRAIRLGREGFERQYARQRRRKAERVRHGR